MWLKLKAIDTKRHRWQDPTRGPRALDDVEQLENVGVQNPTERPAEVTEQGEWTFPILINTVNIRELYVRKAPENSNDVITPGTRIVYDNGAAQIVTASLADIEGLIKDDEGVYYLDGSENAGADGSEDADEDED